MFGRTSGVLLFLSGLPAEQNQLPLDSFEAAVAKTNESGEIRMVVDFQPERKIFRDQCAAQSPDRPRLPCSARRPDGRTGMARGRIVIDSVERAPSEN